MGLGEHMFELCMRLGKNNPDFVNNKTLTVSPANLNVCVGDMNAEQGEKLTSELPG